MTDATTWFHARGELIEGFDLDRPAFFGSSPEELDLWGRGGHVVEVELDVSNPVGELELHEIAIGLGLEDVFDEEFSEFPDVSSYLYDARVRRALEERGYDCYRGEDGYLFVTVVWNPDLIRIVAQRPYDEAVPSAGSQRQSKAF